MRGMSEKITEYVNEKKRKGMVYVADFPFFGDVYGGDGRTPHIQVVIWKDLPDFSVQILEKAGYNHYNRQDESVEMVLDEYGTPTDALSIGEIKEWIKNLSNINSNNNISTKIWKQLPDYAIEVLEAVGYTKYDRKTDSIVFVQK